MLDFDNCVVGNDINRLLILCFVIRDIVYCFYCWWGWYLMGGLYFFCVLDLDLEIKRRR